MRNDSLSSISSPTTSLVNSFSIDQLLQLMRTRTISDVRLGLTHLQKKEPEKYAVIVSFYQSL